LKITIVSVNRGSIISISVIVSVTEISLIVSERKGEMFVHNCVAHFPLVSMSSVMLKQAIYKEQETEKYVKISSEWYDADN